MKRTESPVVDYDSDPVLKQIKAKFDKTEEEKEKLNEQAKELCSVLQPFLNDKAALVCVLNLQKEVVEESTNPDRIDVSVNVQFPHKYLINKLLVINNAYQSKLLGDAVSMVLVRIDSLFMDKVVALWKGKHPLLDISIQDYRRQCVRIKKCLK